MLMKGTLKLLLSVPDYPSVSINLVVASHCVW